MPENTFIYDTVYEEFREELQFTDDEMSEAIMFWEDRSLFDELMYRVKRRKWQEEQRNKWLQGEQPEYTVPEDCPFWHTQGSYFIIALFCCLSRAKNDRDPNLQKYPNER